MEISVTNADVDLRKFFPLLPLKLMRNEDRERLIEAGLNGHMLITGASWIGKPFEVFQGKVAAANFLSTHIWTKSPVSFRAWACR